MHRPTWEWEETEEFVEVENEVKLTRKELEKATEERDAMVRRIRILNGEKADEVDADMRSGHRKSDEPGKPSDMQNKSDPPMPMSEWVKKSSDPKLFELTEKEKEERERQELGAKVKAMEEGAQQAKDKKLMLSILPAKAKKLAPITEEPLAKERMYSQVSAEAVSEKKDADSPGRSSGIIISSDDASSSYSVEFDDDSGSEKGKKPKAFCLDKRAAFRASAFRVNGSAHSSRQPRNRFLPV